MRTVDTSKTQRILDAAGQLFAVRHYHEVRMDDIAAKAGVAKGTLYLHFKHKEDLYVGLMLEGLERLGNRVATSIADVRSPEEKIRVLVREAIEFFARAPYLIELSRRIEPLREDGGKEPLWCSKERFFSLLGGIVREFPGGDRLDETDLRVRVLALAGMLREVLFSLPQPWPEWLAGCLAGQFLDGVRHTVPCQYQSPPLPAGPS